MSACCPFFQFAVCIFCAAIFSAYPFPFRLVIFTPLPTFAALYNKHTSPINHIAFILCASLSFSVIHVACLCCSVCVLFVSKCLDNSKTTNTSFSVRQIPSKLFNPFCLSSTLRQTTNFYAKVFLLNSCQYFVRRLCVAVVNHFAVVFVMCFFAYVAVPTLFSAFC